MTGARRPNVKEPVVVEDEPKGNPEVTEKVPDDNPEVEPLPEKEPEPDVPDEEGADIESRNPDEDDPNFLGDAYYQEPDKVEPDEWYPGRPCLNCDATDYKWTVGWGTTCSECSPEAVAAREAAE